MFPIVLDLAKLRVALVGEGPSVERRLALLDKDQAPQVQVYAPHPSDALEAAAGARLIRRLPTREEVSCVHALMLAGLSVSEAQSLKACAEDEGVLVNAEDQSDLCDFHVPGVVRRGELLLTVSTDGASPGLTRRLRCELESAYGPEWASRVQELGEQRRTWKRDGMDFKTVALQTDNFIDEKGWLS
jgi:precorrin-2 dehydrogenase/sirohydrochlorin ferrochelatase